MRRHHDLFLKWVRSAPERERNLRAIAIGLEDRHFRDMQFQHAAATRRLFKGEWADVDSDNWKTWTSDPPPISLADSWIFRVAIPLTKAEGTTVLGRCDAQRRTIWINPCLQDDNLASAATLLHEMIHAYEEQLPASLLQWLTLDLFHRLEKRISRPTLNRLVDASTHSFVHNASHGVLFLLKSLDIDLRYRWPLGTTFGYGRKDMLQGAIRRRRGNGIE